MSKEGWSSLKKTSYTLPYPPSANRYWRLSGGRLHRSKEATDYITEVFYSHLHNDPIDTHVSVEVDVYRPAKRGDLDNTLKVLLDSLRGVAYQDDSQIVEIVARRHDDKKNPRVEVIVRETN